MQNETLHLYGLSEFSAFLTPMTTEEYKAFLENEDWREQD